MTCRSISSSSFRVVTIHFSLKDTFLKNCHPIILFYSISVNCVSIMHLKIIAVLTYEKMVFYGLQDIFHSNCPILGSPKVYELLMNVMCWVTLIKQIIHSHFCEVWWSKERLRERERDLLNTVSFPKCL